MKLESHLKLSNQTDLDKVLTIFFQYFLDSFLLKAVLAIFQSPRGQKLSSLKRHIKTRYKGVKNGVDKRLSI